MSLSLIGTRVSSNYLIASRPQTFQLAYQPIKLTQWVGIQRCRINYYSSYKNHNPTNRFARKFDTDKPNSNSSSSSSSHNQRPRSHKGHQRPLRFEIDEFSSKAKSALTSIIEKIHSKQPNFRVNFINKGKLEHRHLATIINNLDSKKQGIQLVPTNNEGILVKVIPLQDMLKNYSDELAKEMELKLLEQGSKSVLKAMLQREKADKKKSAAKIISLNWNISLSDLRNQKKAELLKRIDKGEKFLVYLDGHKTNPRKAAETLSKMTSELEGRHNSFSLDSNELEPIELKRRNLILDELDSIFEETATKFEVTGSIDKLLILNCTPKEKSIEKNSSVQNDKKQKRLEKQKQKQMKKKENINEDELDSLYLFKIED